MRHEERSYFLIEIPCREGFEDEPLNEPLDEPLNDKDKLILREIFIRQPVNRKQLVDFTGFSAATITRIISKLSSKSIVFIERQGGKKSGGYILTQNGIAYLNYEKLL